MSFRIRSDHPLQQLFRELVHRHFIEGVRIDDPALAAYIANLLVDFTHVNNLYAIRNARGRRLEDVAEMLIESDPLGAGRSFFYERELRKHIGDYTLFLSGLFPEYVGTLEKKPGRPDAFIDYMKAGKESYRVVASFDQFEFRHQAPLFRHLAERFELCVFGLNLVKAALEHTQRTWYGQVRAVIGA